jgi:hypothetical protein
MRSRLAALVLVPSLVGVACGGDGPREAGIRPKQSIAGIQLAMRQEQVREVLGNPAAVGPSGLHGGWTMWRYRAARLRVTFDERERVWDVRTYSAAHRTAGGLGVGTTERQLRSGVRVTCRPYGGPARYREWRVCVDAADYRGPFTSFTLVRGRVRFVTVAMGLAL